jgi:hypothetical protein
LNISSELSEDDDLAGAYVGSNLRVGANCHAAVRESNGSFDISVDVEIFMAGEFSPYDDRLSNDGRTFCWLHQFLSLGLL